MQITQTVTHTVDLHDLGSYTLATFTLAPLPGTAAAPDAGGRLLATSEVRRVTASRSKQKIDKLLRLPTYLPLVEPVKAWLTEVHMEDVATGRALAAEGLTMPDLIERYLHQHGKTSLNPDDAVHIDWYDNSIWPGPGSKRNPDLPLSRVYQLGYRYGGAGEYFHVRRANEILTQHPWVLRVDGDLLFTALLPQAVHDQLQQVAVHNGLAAAHDGHRPALTGHLLTSLVIGRLSSQDTATPLPLSDGSVIDLDIFGLNPALKSEEERAAAREYENDEDY